MTPPGRRDGDESSAGPSEEDEDRAAILARRARFVATAMAGLALGACNPSPQPCLSVAPLDGGLPGDAGTKDAADDDAAADAGATDPGIDGDAQVTPPAGSSAATPGSAAPLEPPAQPPPGPCLRVAAPRPSGSAASSGSAPPAGTTAPPPRLPPPSGTFPAPCLKIAPPQGGR